MSQGGIVREAAFIGEAAPAFFAWTHHAPGRPSRGLVAVLCGPIGSEYTRSHRSLRHLADRLAMAGIPALRFDYHGTGNSPGTDLDPGRVEAWLGNIREAAAYARRWSGCDSVVLLGVRLGGTLAAIASESIAPAGLVLWNAPAKGRPYVRELQAIAMTAARAADSEGSLEAAGFVMTAETLEALRRIDLLQAPMRAGRALVVSRDDLAPDAALPDRFRALGIPVECLSASGWNGMMADHQHTVVPEESLDCIVDHVASWSRGPRPATAPALAPRQAADRMPMSFTDDRHAVPATVEEVLCRFGSDRHLFGVLTRGDSDPSKPAILMFNGGAVHHVGPNRLYVTLARSLAALGFACLRFDLEGIGDSVLRGPGRENHPYPDHATRDAHAAIEYLRERYGYRRFIALGLCSGAHTAFHSGLQFADDIQDLILINPYAFYWKEGMSLDVVTKLADAKAYRKSMRDPGRWLKLLRGDVNVRRLLDVALSQPATLARSYYGVLCEHLAPSRAPPLARDLRRLFDSKRSVTVLTAEGEPGGDIIMTEAKWTAKQGMKRGCLRMETIEGGDHTFTQSRTRRALVERVAEHLRDRTGPAT